MERLLRHGLPGRPRASTRTPRSPASSSRAATSRVVHTRSGPWPSTAPWAPRARAARRARSRTCTAATPTPTSPTVIPQGAEVHASGEIWGQTLWQIRQTLGHTVADTLITRAMSLSPTEPSFLDMRNAILEADLIAYNSEHTPKHVEDLRQPRHGLLRGLDRRGATPPRRADFHTPPAPFTPRTTVDRRERDRPDHGRPDQRRRRAQSTGQGQPVRHARSPTDGGQLHDRRDLSPGTYAKVVAVGAGLPGRRHAGKAVSNRRSPLPVTTVTDFALTQDWAAGSRRSHDRRTSTARTSARRCGPDGAIDTEPRHRLGKHGRRRQRRPDAARSCPSTSW